MHGHCSPGGKKSGTGSEKTGALQSVNSRIVHKQCIAWKKWNAAHFLFNLYLGIDLVGIVDLLTLCIHE